ncbi:helix-turn-helix domain-containing protein [Nonomuraea candida]|uniref:helix-turn-helix domain-containing protein n=1 Tax=Nonomuraea candida TaxID=359159 RepID=UPI000694F739|nr:helix-turn-helix transcriptional regulator [Nonomuraea candida]
MAEDGQKYGEILKKARDSAHLSQRALGELLSCSESLVGLIERGKRKPTKQFTLAAEAALGLDGELFELLPNTTVMTVPKWFREWPRAEERAHTIRTWQPLVVPGLLQTAGYARAVLGAWPHATDEWVEEGVEARLKRQAVFDRGEPPVYRALIDECVLLRPVGGNGVMRDQLRHLLRMAERPNISIQVVPLDVGATVGVLGAFSLAQGDGMSDHVYLEAAAQPKVSVHQETVRRIDGTYDAIREWAHPVHMSRRLMREVVARYEDR